MNKNNFTIGQQIDTKVYTYDDPLRNYVKKVQGTVYQITDNIVVIQKKYYKESYQYRDFYKYNAMEYNNAPYELEEKRYSQDIVDNCVQDFKEKGEGYIFNYAQLKNSIEKIKPTKYSFYEDNGIYYLKNLEFSV